jgi:hypothetical protein
VSVLLLGAAVWFVVAVLLAVGVGRVLARADVDLPDMDVSRAEWQAHCDEALTDEASRIEQIVWDALRERLGLHETWSATDEAAYRVTVERAT